MDKWRGLAKTKAKVETGESQQQSAVNLQLPNISRFKLRELTTTNTQDQEDKEGAEPCLETIFT